MRLRSVALALVTVVAAAAYSSAAPGVVGRTRPTSAVTGTITAGPTCPVETIDHPCPPRPVSAGVAAQRRGGGVAARTHSDSNGRYAMRLAPGRYTLVVQTGSRFPYCPPTNVTVTRGQVVTADISCDTGIR